MTTATAAVLKPIGEARIALESVDIQAHLHGLFADVMVTQVYRNLENVNIEAVYTFPLPMDAVLLDLTLELNGQILRGLVQPKSLAEGQYEDAIDEGDSAILLQQVEPGVFTLNVGNILPNEKTVIRFRYGLLHRWHGDSLRFSLPTTIAPRYGDPLTSGLAPHQLPEYELTTDHGFALELKIVGELAQANFDCPSHPIAVSMTSGTRIITLSSGSAYMDRDFVLLLKKPSGSTGQALCAPDEDGYVVLASFHPAFPDDVPRSPRCVKLVVDCSGSMGGDSIAQAKTALHEIISLLKPTDYFNLIIFGTGFHLLFPEPVIASKENIRAAALYVEKIDAYMGGTEIGSALNAAYRCGIIEGLPVDLLLITDGQVWNHEKVVEDAIKSGHRIFTVGVGSAVSESFVRRIAETTAGACELVTPRENMSEHIVRHFMRIDQPRAKTVKIEWSTTPVYQVPGVIKSVYAGDTLHVFGWLRERPTGNVRLVMSLEDDRIITQEVSLSMELADSEELSIGLPRIAAHARLTSLDEEESRNLAVRYQLVTEQTSYILVLEREKDHKSGKIPALRKVSQMLAAGWGGIGRIGEVSYSKRGVVVDGEPAYCRRQSDGTPFDQLISALNERYPETTATELDIATLSEFKAMGLDLHKYIRLRNLNYNVYDKGDYEQELIVFFLMVLVESAYGKKFTRHVKRLIRSAYKNITTDSSANIISKVLIKFSLNI